VRPTDENQTGSRRPNLMSSSRRTGGEINILAMLDGHTRKPGRYPGLPKAAWYGGGGVLACALVATVAWLVHDQAGSGFEGRVPAGPPMVALDITPETVPNPALHVDPPRAHGAAVVSVADVAVPAVAAAAPPLQSDAPALDEAHQDASALPAVVQAATSAAPAAVPVAVAAAAPATAPIAVAAAVPVSAHAASPVVHTHPRMLSRAVTSASRNNATDARREAPAHPHRTAAVAKTKPVPAPVDTDVALISAIIQHMNKPVSQRGELKDAAGCGDQSCAAKMPNRP